MRTIEFTLPIRTPLLNELLRMHHTKRRLQAKDMAMYVLSAINRSGQRRPAEPFARCHIEIVRGSEGLPDWDGLYGGLKPLLDSFVVASRRNPHGLGLIIDDNPKCLVSLHARPEKVSRGRSFTQVLIAEVIE